MSHAANTSIQDIQNGIGDFVLRPEADRNSLDGYMKLPDKTVSTPAPMDVSSNKA